MFFSLQALNSSRYIPLHSASLLFLCCFYYAAFDKRSAKCLSASSFVKVCQAVNYFLQKKMPFCVKSRQIVTRFVKTCQNR